MKELSARGCKKKVNTFIFSGGEPLLRKKDIIRLCERHRDCYFMAFNNGTLIDEQFASDVARVGNFAPAISIEGFEEMSNLVPSSITRAQTSRT